MKRTSISNLTEKLIHIVVWAFLFGSPLLLLDRSSESGVIWFQVTHRLGGPLGLFILFYANYLWLTPKYFLQNKRAMFITVNVVLCLFFCTIFPVWEQVFRADGMDGGPGLSEILNMRFGPEGPIPKKPRRNANPWDKALASELQDREIKHDTTALLDSRKAKNDSLHQTWRGGPKPPHGNLMQRSILGKHMPLFFLLRDLLMQVLCIIIAVTARMSKEWRQSEHARKEAELGKTEAELKNLRSQINPHFLLNTLNNIYALIAFDQDKAQETVQDLSKLLRHILYDNQQDYVSLDSEVEFLEKYVDLMKIRQTVNTEVTFKKNIPHPNNIQVAPLLFISLVENAFKHGIRTSEHSFIHMQISYEEGNLHFYIENSNFPKDQCDRSGSGIGLGQMQQRLDLMYPKKYLWKKGVKDNTYYSDIQIKII